MKLEGVFESYVVSQKGKCAVEMIIILCIHVLSS